MGMVIELEKDGETWSASLKSTEGFHVVEIDGVHKETALLHANSLLKIAFDVLGDMPVRSTSVMRYHKFGWLAHSSGRKPLYVLFEGLACSFSQPGEYRWWKFSPKILIFPVVR